MLELADRPQVTPKGGGITKCLREGARLALLFETGFPLISEIEAVPVVPVVHNHEAALAGSGPALVGKGGRAVVILPSPRRRKRRYQSRRLQRCAVVSEWPSG